MTQNLEVDEQACFSGPSDKDLQPAFDLYKAGDLKAAGKACVRILRNQDDDSVATYLLGLVYARMDRISEAASLIFAAISRNPTPLTCRIKENLIYHLGETSCVAVWESALIEYFVRENIDSFVISFPSCGRTWLRILLGNYLLGDDVGNPLDIRKITQTRGDCLTTAFTHDDEPHKKPFTMIQEDKSYYADRNVILLVCDPRDIVVSYYFEYMRRGGKELANESNYSGTLSDFVWHDCTDRVFA